MLSVCFDAELWSLPLAALAVDYCGVVAAVAADFISGVAKARHAGLRRTSAGYRRSFDKLGRYLLALAGLTVVDAVVMAAVACWRRTGGMIVPMVPWLSSVGAVCVALTEAKSVCERLEHKGDFHRAFELLEQLVKALRANR